MIAAIIAMQSEADILLEQMEISQSLIINNKKIYVGKAFKKDIAVCVCGVGKVNAALGTQLIIDRYNIEKILNFGVAGSLNHQTKLCEIYQIAHAVQFDFDLAQLNGTSIGTLNEYTENYLALHTLELSFELRKLGTADRFNDSQDDYQLLTKELAADIRDMEGAAIVQAAYAANLPIISIKAISDVAGSGSTTEQFLKNKNNALLNLKTALPSIFEKL